jgi:ubiquinone/menaquinone biosynthesis C-methylase UbiE
LPAGNDELVRRCSLPSWYRHMQAALLVHCMSAYEALVAARKRALFADLHGDVLEIGPGVGANLPLLPPSIRWIGIEPNPQAHRYVIQRAAKQGMTIDLRVGIAEALDVPDASMDAVIGTLVLCSIRDPEAALREVLRVLKPGGRFVFMEHVAAPRGSWLRRVQRLVRPIWKCVTDGCHLDRETWAVIQAAGFAEVNVERFWLPVGFAAPHIIGTAHSPGIPG